PRRLPHHPTQPWNSPGPSVRESIHHRPNHHRSIHRHLSQNHIRCHAKRPDPPHHHP
ncbi:hypothetical protein DAPPUDRAFT_303, partial [Daphnia pulex]